MDKTTKRSFLSSISSLTSETDVPLSRLTSFQIGGLASVVVHPRSTDDFLCVTRAAKKHDLPWKVLGFGTNILAPDEGYDGVIIRMDTPFHEPVIFGTAIRCSAGDSLARVSKLALNANLSGMEGLSGIPGTIGGAGAMNAGAFGAEMKDILHKVTIFQDDTVSETIVKDSDLGLRASAFSFPKAVILEVELNLREDDGTAAERTLEYTLRRKAKQPLEMPSAGSVFKRPAGHFAGGLIEQCGLKGLSVGGAQVSPKHAGFIVNTGNATCMDVRELVLRIQETVQAEAGVLLERELKYWDEV